MIDEIVILVLDDFGDETRADPLVVLVELDLSVRRVEHERATGTPWLWPASRDPHRLP
jgi:hypothetical protein